MAFALDAADVESFMAEADFSCIASGAQEARLKMIATSNVRSSVQDGLVKSYLSIKTSDLPGLNDTYEGRVMLEALLNSATLSIRIVAKAQSQAAVTAAIAHAESLFGM